MLNWCLKVTYVELVPESYMITGFGSSVGSVSALRSECIRFDPWPPRTNIIEEDTTSRCSTIFRAMGKS